MSTSASPGRVSRGRRPLAHRFLDDLNSPGSSPNTSMMHHWRRVRSRDRRLREEEDSRAAPLLEREAPVGSYRAGRVRFLILLVSSCMLLGSYYNFDLPSSTKNQIKDWAHVDAEHYGVLAGVYSYPNMIMPLMGGLMIDAVGVNKSVGLFVLVITLGQVFWAFGMSERSFWILMLGRLIFGFGGECLNVANSTLMTQWFRGKELAFALGTSLTVSRLGSVLVFNTQPAIVQEHGIVAGCLVGVAFCFLSGFCAFLSGIIEHRAEVHDRLHGLSSAADASDPVALRDVASFGLLYWCICLSCVFSYIAIFPFYQVVSADFLQSPLTFSFSLADANLLSSIPNLVSAIFSPLFAILVDRKGKRPQLLTFSAGVLVVAHTGFLLFPSLPQCWWVASLYILMGLAVAMYGSVIWPCIPFVVDASKVGTAFGLTFAVQNIGQAIAPIVLETTMPEGDEGSFAAPLLFIIVCATLGTCAAVALWFFERQPGYSTGLEAGVAEEVAEMCLASPQLPRAEFSDDEPTTVGRSAASDAGRAHLQPFMQQRDANRQFRRTYYYRLGLGR